MKLSEELCIREVGGRNIVYGFRSSDGQQHVICLNNSTVWLLEQLSGKEFTLEEAVSLVCSRYNVDMDTARQDISSVLDIFCANGLLQK
ncbi:MAG: PqqD family protein [Bacteroidaceae bacterium]|nr:PqqD family protein [Bacteroidaceae bacterium]